MYTHIQYICNMYIYIYIFKVYIIDICIHIICIYIYVLYIYVYVRIILHTQIISTQHSNESPQVGSAYLVMKPGVPWTKPAAEVDACDRQGDPLELKWIYMGMYAANNGDL